MTHESGDEVSTRLRQVHFVISTKERIVVAIEQRHVCVHSRSVAIAKWSRHECGKSTGGSSKFFCNNLESNNRIGHRQSVRVTKIDLVLPNSNFVMAVLHGDAHFFKG